MPNFDPCCSEYCWCGVDWELLLKSRQDWRDQYQLTVSWQIFSAFRLAGACSITSSLTEGWAAPPPPQQHHTTKPLLSSQFLWLWAEVKRSKYQHGMLCSCSLIFILRGWSPPGPCRWWVLGSGHCLGGGNWCVCHCVTVTLRHCGVTLNNYNYFSLSLSSCWGRLLTGRCKLGTRLSLWLSGDRRAETGPGQPAPPG